jgi:Icc-related predicted phosphoesterase
MRLVYSADLHGDITSYQALLELAVEHRARAAIVGGDLLPHAIKLQSAIQAQRGFIATQLRPLLSSFRRQHPAIDIYLLAGNDDWAAAIATLADLEQEDLIYPLHGRVYQLSATDRRPPTSALHIGGRQLSAGVDNLWLAGYPCVPITPFSIKDYERRDDRAAPAARFDFGMAYASWDGALRKIEPSDLASRPSLAEDLDELARQSDPRHTIYVCHTPPADTPLDQMPRGRHVGSRAVRAFIEQRQPPITLHGHIHEAPDESGQYAIRIGQTWCINPGHSARRFQAVAFDTGDLAGTIEHTVFGRPTQV